MGADGSEVVCVSPIIRRRQCPDMHCASDHQDVDVSTTCRDRCLNCLTASLSRLVVITSVVFFVSTHRTGPRPTTTPSPSPDPPRRLASLLLYPANCVSQKRRQRSSQHFLGLGLGVDKMRSSILELWKTARVGCWWKLYTKPLCSDNYRMAQNVRSCTLLAFLKRRDWLFCVICMDFWTFWGAFCFKRICQLHRHHLLCRINSRHVVNENQWEHATAFQHIWKTRFNIVLYVTCSLKTYFIFVYNSLTNFNEKSTNIADRMLQTYSVVYVNNNLSRAYVKCSLLTEM